jgi:hypothetical protein
VDINTEAWSSGMGVGRGANNLTLYERKLLRSLQEIQPDFEEEAKALSWAVEPRKESLVLYPGSTGFDSRPLFCLF